MAIAGSAVSRWNVSAASTRFLPRRNRLAEQPTTGPCASRDQSGNSITMPADVQVTAAPKARNRCITLLLSEATEVMIRFAGRGRVSRQQMAQNMPQSGALIVVGNRHADIKRVRILGISRESGRRPQAARSRQKRRRQHDRHRRRSRPDVEARPREACVARTRTAAVWTSPTTAERPRRARPRHPRGSVGSAPGGRRATSPTPHPGSSPRPTQRVRRPHTRQPPRRRPEAAPLPRPRPASPSAPP